MGGKSSSSSATTTQNTTNVTDRRTVADNGAVVVGDGGSYSYSGTDYGAVSGAITIAGQAQDTAQKAVVGATSIAARLAESADKSSQLANDAGKVAIAAVAKAYDAAQDQAQGNRTLAYVGLTIAGVLALGMVGKKRG